MPKPYTPLLIIGFSLFVGCISLYQHEKPIAGGRLYTVQKGDSLSKISRRYRVPVTELLDINGLKNKDKLKSGHKIYIPDHAPAFVALDRKIGYKKSRKTAKYVPKNSNKRVPKIKLDWPLSSDIGVIVQKYSENPRTLYEGLGIAAPRGSKVKAARAGKVVYSGIEENGYGNMVVLKHDNSFLTLYGHLAGVRVKLGQRLAAGALIGSVGQTGNTKDPRLFFQIRHGRDPLNPSRFLKR